MADKQKMVVDPTTLPGVLAAHGQNPTEVKPSTEMEFNEPKPAHVQVMPINAEQAREGLMEAVKETAKEGRKNQQKLEDLVDKAVTVLYKVGNIMPMFKSEIIIDTSKITIVHRPFLFSERIHSVSIRDISDCYIETAPFFATINIVDRDFVENVTQVKWIRKANAERARRIITGLVSAAKEEIDITKLDHNQLVQKLEEIGRVRETTTTVTNA